jgi:ATP-binding cassette subfamily F protein uup
MQLLNLENISKSYGEKILFKDINLSISQGQKIALLARNGSGKSTLLRIIAGEEAPEGENARIYLTKDIRVSVLKQEPDFLPEESIHEIIYNTDNPKIKTYHAYTQAQETNNAADIDALSIRMDELQAWDTESVIEETLAKLNIKNHSKLVSELSGGQVKRLAIARMILEQPDFLILDEPTNHLDIEMIEWLENYLQQSSITLFMVTHDRYFLDRICNEIIELDRGVLHIYRGNYSDYLEKKALRSANEASNLDKMKKLYNKELQWIRRQPKARGTKAKSRVDDFDRISDASSVNLDEEQISLDIKSSRLGSKILEAHAISKSYGDLKIIETFSYKFRKGERLGIVGPNGAGKSTFLNLLTQEIRPDAGKIVVGDTIEFGYYTQDGLNLDNDKRVIDVIRDIAEYIPLDKGKKITAESLLERFLFSRAQQQVYISQLSGGEKRRLYLLTILMKNPNFLILDEPTNDLDILTLNILEDYLMQFPGCLLIVSHDRYFLNKMVEHLFIIEGNGNIKDYNGKYSEYRASKKNTTKENNASAEPAPAKKTSAIDHQERKKIKNQIRKLEREISKLEERKTAINNMFLDPAGLDNDKITTLSQELGEINSSIESKEEQWMGLSDD